MEKRRISLYSMIFLICFFLIVSFFFSTDSAEYITGAAETKESTKETHISKTSDTSEIETKNSKALNVFYEKIQSILSQFSGSFNGDVGMTYVDLTTGKNISVNGQKDFYTASTIKVPLAMFIADKVEAGVLKWDTQIPYNEEEDYEEGTGLIIYDIQPSYSLRMLQEYNIIYSDNIAKNMLYDALGGDKKARTDLYNYFFKKTPNLESTQITSNEAASILLKLYEKKATNKEYQTIYEYMKRTAFHERMETPVTTGKVAHKVGSYEDYIHDIGILEAPHPFILTVYTKGQNGIPFISQVTEQLWKIQTTDYPLTNQ